MSSSADLTKKFLKDTSEQAQYCYPTFGWGFHPPKLMFKNSNIIGTAIPLVMPMPLEFLKPDGHSFLTVKNMALGGTFTMGLSLLNWLSNCKELQGHDVFHRPKKVDFLQIVTMKDDPNTICGYNYWVFINESNVNVANLLTQLFRTNNPEMFGHEKKESRQNYVSRPANKRQRQSLQTQMSDLPSSWKNFTYPQIYVDFATMKNCGLTYNAAYLENDEMLDLSRENDPLNPLHVFHPRHLQRLYIKRANPKQIDWNYYHDKISATTTIPDEDLIYWYRLKPTDSDKKRFLHLYLPTLQPVSPLSTEEMSYRNLICTDEQLLRENLLECEQVLEREVKHVIRSCVGESLAANGNVTWRHLAARNTEFKEQIEKDLQYLAKQGTDASILLKERFERYEDFFFTGLTQARSVMSEAGNCSMAVQNAAKFLEDYSKKNNQTLYNCSLPATANLGPLNNFYLRCYVALEDVELISTNHEQVLLNLIAIHNASDPDRKNKFCVLNIGDPAAGKSKVLDTAESWCVPDTVLSLSHQTMRANTAAINKDGIAERYDEIPASWMGADGNRTGGSNSAEEGRFKQQLTEGRVVTQTLVIGDDGKRTSSVIVADCNQSFIVCSNLKKMYCTSAILSRFLSIDYTLKTREKNKDITHLLCAPSNPKQKDHKKMMQERFQLLHAIILMTNQLITVNLFDPILTDFTNMFLTKFCDYIRSRGVTGTLEPRNILRIRLAVKVFVLWRAYHLVFESLISPIRGEFNEEQQMFMGMKWSLEQLKFLQPYLNDHDPSILIQTLGLLGPYLFETRETHSVLRALAQTAWSQPQLFSPLLPEQKQDQKHSQTNIAIPVNALRQDERELLRQQQQPSMNGDVPSFDFLAPQPSKANVKPSTPFHHGMSPSERQRCCHEILQGRHIEEKKSQEYSQMLQDWMQQFSFHLHPAGQTESEDLNLEYEQYYCYHVRGLPNDSKPMHKLYRVAKLIQPMVKPSFSNEVIVSVLKKLQETTIDIPLLPHQSKRLPVLTWVQNDLLLVLKTVILNNKPDILEDGILSVFEHKHTIFSPYLFGVTDLENTFQRPKCLFLIPNDQDCVVESANCIPEGRLSISGNCYYSERTRPHLSDFCDTTRLKIFNLNPSNVLHLEHNVRLSFSMDYLLQCRIMPEFTIREELYRLTQELILSWQNRPHQSQTKMSHESRPRLPMIYPEGFEKSGSIDDSLEEEEEKQSQHFSGVPERKLAVTMSELCLQQLWKAGYSKDVIQALFRSSDFPEVSNTNFDLLQNQHTVSSLSSQMQTLQPFSTDSLLPSPPKSPLVRSSDDSTLVGQQCWLSDLSLE